MARKPDEPSKPLREWRVSILRDKVHHLGRVVAADKEAAFDEAMEELASDRGCLVRLKREVQSQERTATQ